MQMVTNTSMAYQGSTPKAESTVSVSAESKVQPAEEERKAPETASLAGTAAVKQDEPSTGIQSSETIKKAVEEINKKTNTEAVFGIHDATNRVTIKIVDKESKEIIKEYPPEQTLDMIAKVWEMAGILIDEKR